MTKARFYIRGKVQDVGYRPYIMKEVIKREGLNGIADNYKKDSVEVLLEGEENKIVDFYDFLKKEENKPQEAEVKEISELEVFNSTTIHVPKASEYSQALTFEQLGKGIPILKGIYRSIEGTNENIKGMSTRIEGMDENIKGMSTRIEGMDGNVKGMSTRIEGMNENIKGMSARIERTNENIKGMSTRIEGMDENIKGMSTRIEGMDENIRGMREEMWEGFDKLPERIAKELKEILR